MTANSYIDHHYDDDPDRHIGDATSGYDDRWDQESTPTVPRPVWRRMPPKKDLAVRALSASLDRSTPLFVAIPAIALTVGLSHWLAVGTLLKAGWIAGYALVVVAAGFQLAKSNGARRRANLALWLIVAAGTIWMVAG